MKKQLLFLFFLAFSITEVFAQKHDPQAAYETYLLAEKLLKAQKYAEASVLFDKAMSLDATNYAILYERGRCYIKLRNYEKAAYSFQRVVELKEDYTTAYLLLGFLHNAVGRYDDAIKDYNKAYRYETDFQRKFTLKMIILNIYDKQNRLPEAEGHLAEAKSLGIENEHYHYFQGKTKNHHHQYREAKEHLLKAIARIEKLPYDSIAVEMGERLFQQSAEIAAEQQAVASTSNTLPQEAKPVVAKPVNNAVANKTLANTKPRAIAPERIAKYYYELYLSLCKLNQHDKAEDIYNKADFEPYKSKMKPLHLSYLYNLAYAYYMIYDFEKARNFVDDIIVRQGDHNGGTKLGFKIMEAENDKTSVLNDMEAAWNDAKEGKQKEDILKSLVKTALESQQYDKVIAWADIFMNTYPNNHEVLLMKAVALSKKGDEVAAKTAFMNLVSQTNLDKKSVSRYNLAFGLFAYQQGEFKLAAKAFQRCTYMYYKSAAYRELKKFTPEELK
ncbi:MAG: tetratricopeptide repeat protein [Thermoflexibacteraceae bacterium]